MKPQLLKVYGVLAMAGFCLLIGSPASAKGNTQISGMGFADALPPSNVCDNAPLDFTDFTIVLEGDLVGCLYTAVDWFQVSPNDDNPDRSHVYQERGREVIEACLDLDGDGCDPGDPYGMFETTYHFTSKWAGAPFESAQINGRCQHPIVSGSGTDDFSGATGRLDFKDNVAEGDFDWRGHIDLADSI